ncbi:MAG: ion transporter [Pseudomonadota bacterium]
MTSGEPYTEKESGAPEPLPPITDRQRVQNILDGDDPVFGRRVALTIQALIIVSVLSITIETLPGLPDWLHTVFFVEEMFVVAVVLTEYILRIYAAKRRLAYVTSFFGIIDLLSIAPALLLLGYDLRSLRAIRALRILSLLKLMRYVAAFERLAKALRSVRDELVVFAGVAGVLLYLCATAVYLFENEAQPEAFASIPHSLWWAVVTFTTVGYGDVYPVTAGGRIFTGVILILALGVVAVPTGLIATALNEEMHRPTPEPGGETDPPQNKLSK